jgi:hypothetical protein
MTFMNMGGGLGGGLGGAAIGTLGSAAAQFIQSIFVRPRNIAGFIANVTLEEQHTDVMTITRHPVAQGSVIADHAYKEPAVVLIRAGWTNSGGLNTLFDPSYVETIYKKFLALQSSIVPFSIITGKRAYTNMLIHRLATSTSRETENALMLTVECHEIIMATTQIVTTPPASGMQSPQVNGGTQQQGNVQTTPGAYNSGAALPKL